ncbi:MAG: SUF system NifU family Fe-S cluster assembly protein [Gammaproteobacteria bacterium]|nr:SUF system NifU family Fe-S cluster assembly protein [Gammaproteobacteria bacterium]
MNAVDINRNDELRDLYRELILDHAKNPRHFGKLANPTHSAAGINPLCGDKLHLYVHVDAEDRIDNASFEGAGCAISVASASLMTDTVIGMTVAEALDYFAAITRRMTKSMPAESAGIDLGKLVALDGVREYPSRIKCATLAWHALNSALHERGATVTTE